MLLRAALFVLGLVVAGCGPIAAGVALGTGSRGGGTSSPANTPPSVTVETPAGRSTTGAVTLAYTLFDAERDATSIAVVFSATRRGPAATLATGTAVAGTGGDGTASLASDPLGRRHTFVWDYRTSLGDSAHRAAITIVASDAAGSSIAQTTAVFDVGNDAPVLRQVATLGSTANVVVSYRIDDTSGDVCSLAATFASPQVAGGVPQPITAVAGAGLSAVKTDDAGATLDGSFVWDTFVEPGLATANLSQVVVTLTPRDQDGLVGAPRSAAPFSLVNDAAPAAQLLSIGTRSGVASVDGRVPVRFAFFDPDAERAPGTASAALTARLEVSTDGGATFGAATGLVVREGALDLGLASLDGLRALAAPHVAEGQGGNVHTFLWDALADGASGTGRHSVVLRVTPLSAGAPGLSDQRSAATSGRGPARLGRAERPPRPAPRAARAGAAAPAGDGRGHRRRDRGRPRRRPARRPRPRQPGHARREHLPGHGGRLRARGDDRARPRHAAHRRGAR